MLQDYILRDGVICGIDSNFDSLDVLSGMILYFDHNNFSSKNIIHPKIEHLLASLFYNIVHDIEVKFDMVTMLILFLIDKINLVCRNVCQYLWEHTI